MSGRIIDFDVDIEIGARNELLDTLDTYVHAADRSGHKHPSGVYFQPIPKDYRTNISTIDFVSAKDLGYFKVDLLSKTLYSNIKDEAHLYHLMNKTPPWHLLTIKSFVEKLDQIHRHYDIVNFYKPDSIQKMAMLLAIIRPGKKHLQYHPWSTIEKSVWIRDDNEAYFFKKSHSIAYSIALGVQMNLLEESFGDK